MKKSEMLRACKEILWDGGIRRYGKPRFICCALESAVGIKETKELRGIISKRLEGSPTVMVWLNLKRNIPLEQLTEAAVQAHRHAWVDLMIKEFEEIGE